MAADQIIHFYREKCGGGDCGLKFCPRYDIMTIKILTEPRPLSTLLFVKKEGTIHLVYQVTIF